MQHHCSLTDRLSSMLQGDIYKIVRTILWKQKSWGTSFNRKEPFDLAAVHQLPNFVLPTHNVVSFDLI